MNNENKALLNKIKKNVPFERYVALKYQIQEEEIKNKQSRNYILK